MFNHFFDDIHLSREQNHFDRWQNVVNLIRIQFDRRIKFVIQKRRQECALRNVHSIKRELTILLY